METVELPLDCPTLPVAELRLSEVISAMSYALDITEGQPEGHAVRTCLIGMRLAEALVLSAEDRSDLFYALLLKDLGCSSNAAKMCFLFGADERAIKRDLKTIDWTKLGRSVQFMSKNLLPDGSPLQRALHTAVVALEGPGASRKLVQTRCERGAKIARRLGFSPAAATAILHLDEHWNGKGQPDGLQGEEISLLGRIANLAQTVEVFFATFGPQAARDMVSERRGRWFDPELSDLFLSLAGDAEFWEQIGAQDPRTLVGQYEPPDQTQLADEACVDRIARAFAQVVDAKSPWTFRHSEGVAHIATGMANVLGLPETEVNRICRAALLHDIGKLGVSNLVLDKPGKLTDEEFAALRRHPDYTQRILERVACFRDVADIAGAHHERLDGRGYHRGLSAAELPQAARLLAVADVCDALSSSRPYRAAMSREQVREAMHRGAGTDLCPECLEALDAYQEQAAIIDRTEVQLFELDRLLAEL